MGLFNPIARRTDPESSHAAASEISRSAMRENQCATILALVRAYPWSTAGELATWCGYDSVQITKRLNDLKHAGQIEKGRIRTCEIHRRKMLTWGEVMP